MNTEGRSGSPHRRWMPSPPNPVARTSVPTRHDLAVSSVPPW